MSDDYGGSPTWGEVDELLVRAALSRGDEALDLWAYIRLVLDPSEVTDPERLRLLPTIGKILATADPENPDVSEIQLLADENSTAQAQAAEQSLYLIDQLGGIPAWITGGAALARAKWAYAGDLGCRWADDTAVVVRPADVIAAIETLSACGWTFPPPKQVQRRIDWYGSVPMWSPLGTPSELCWQPSGFIGDEVDWHDGGEELDLGGVATRLFPPAITLACVVTNARLDWRYAGFSWILDVHRILESGQVDVDEAAVIADRCDLSDAFAGGMSIVNRARSLDSLAGWLDTCSATMSDGDRRRADFESFGHTLSTPQLMSGIPQFVADQWSLNSAWQVPPAAIKRLFTHKR